MKMPLQFHINVVPAKNVGQSIDPAACFFHAALSKSKGQWTVVIAGKADESGSMLLKFFFPHRAFAFGRAQLHFRNQTAEILISGTRRDEQGKAKCTTEAQRHRGID